MEHKIKKIKVYPKEPILWKNGVYLGMSMNNQMFRSVDTVCEMLQLISTYTNQCEILVGDFLHRYNEQIFEGYNEQEAINISQIKGKKLRGFFEEAIIKFPIKYNFLYTGEFLMRPEFSIKLKRFKNLYNSHTRFHELINYTVNIFLRRQNDIKISLDKAKELCREYLFEELIIFEILAEKGLEVNIYPGNQLPLIKELVAGRLKGVSEILEKIQAIEIKFRPS